MADSLGLKFKMSGSHSPGIVGEDSSMMGQNWQGNKQQENARGSTLSLIPSICPLLLTPVLFALPAHLLTPTYYFPLCTSHLPPREAHMKVVDVQKSIIHEYYPQILLFTISIQNRGRSFDQPPDHAFPRPLAYVQAPGCVMCQQAMSFLNPPK